MRLSGSQSAKSIVQELLDSANITINGNKPDDIQVHNEQFYKRTLNDGPLGLGESYMEGWWDCFRVDQFIEKLLYANLDNKIKKSKRLLFKIAIYKLINLQTRKRALVVGEQHYDLGLSLFQSMLDSRMNYTCGYWKNAADLETAQLAKLELTCQKLLIKPGMRLLDVGCGFGAFAKYAAMNFGAEVVGITISKEQYHFAKKNTAGLPVEIRFQDYRDVHETFDRIVSLGMFEHVGHLNYLSYMQVIHRCLIDDGIFLLHTIGDNVTEVPNEWITKYIFPHGMLPSIALIGKAIEGLFVMEDWHNFGVDYDKTLMAWQQNFERNWDTLKVNFNERFYRMWNYYLLSCAGGFRSRGMQLWQIVLSKKGLAGGYQAPR